jgi:hypothetical protein
MRRDFFLKKEKKKKKKEAQFLPPVFLVVTVLNSLAVVVCKPNAAKKGFMNLHFGGIVVTDLPSKIVIMTQT